MGGILQMSCLDLIKGNHGHVLKGINGKQLFPIEQVEMDQDVQHVQNMDLIQKKMI